MKKLFIYYSFSGNVDKIAQKYKENGYEVFKVETIKPLPKLFFIRVMIDGFLAGIGAKARIKPLENNFDNYEKIVIGSPVWNGKLSCPINSVLQNKQLQQKPVSFVLASGSGKAPKIEKQIKKLFNNVKFTVLKEPLTHPTELEKLEF